MIAAVDSEGDSYLSFTQVNTDTDVMQLYLTQLVIELEKDRPNLRKNIPYCCWMGPATISRPRSKTTSGGSESR